MDAKDSNLGSYVSKSSISQETPYLDCIASINLNNLGLWIESIKRKYKYKRCREK
jgi:hypothetical protein